MRRWLLMATLTTACVVATGCFRNSMRDGMFRGDPCGQSQPARGGLFDCGLFGSRDRVQPVVVGYGSCACDSCTVCEGMTSYSPGFDGEIVEGGTYYEGAGGSFSGGDIISGSDGTIIERIPDGAILPGPAR